MDKYTELEKEAQKFLDETDTMQFSTVELLTMFYNHKQQCNIPVVVSSFIYVLKAKDREEPLWVYKTYQKAYRGKKDFAKKNWHNTYIEKWKIS